MLSLKKIKNSRRQSNKMVEKIVAIIISPLNRNRQSLFVFFFYSFVWFKFSMFLFCYVFLFGEFICFIVSLLLISNNKRKRKVVATFLVLYRKIYWRSGFSIAKLWFDWFYQLPINSILFYCINVFFQTTHSFEWINYCAFYYTSHR